MDNISTNEWRRKALTYALITDIVSTALNSHGTTADLSTNNQLDYNTLLHNAVMTAWKKKGV